MGAGVREINAVIAEAAFLGEVGRHLEYRLTLRPWLHRAELQVDCRIFQNKTVDRTSHGGVVITGSETDFIDKRPIARLGDLVDCPRRDAAGVPHGINRIIEGDAEMLLNGRPVALEGHRTECGCALIGSGRGNVG